MIEREYIKYLLNELDNYRNLEEEVENLTQENINYKNKVLELSNELTQKELTLNSESVEFKKQLKEKDKIIEKIKTDMKKPVTISNPISFDIFSELKKGNIIKEITPTVNKNFKSYKTNPFTFELDNKGAIFESNKLLGMWEYKKGNYYYYHIGKGSMMVNNEILRLLRVVEKTRECNIHVKGGRKFGRNLSQCNAEDILKRNPIVCMSQGGRFVSTKDTKYIYTENDGSRFIVLEDGSKEVYD